MKEIEFSDDTVEIYGRLFQELYDEADDSASEDFRKGQSCLTLVQEIINHIADTLAKDSDDESEES